MALSALRMLSLKLTNLIWRCTNYLYWSNHTLHHRNSNRLHVLTKKEWKILGNRFSIKLAQLPLRDSSSIQLLHRQKFRSNFSCYLKMFYSLLRFYYVSLPTLVFMKWEICSCLELAIVFCHINPFWGVSTNPLLGLECYVLCW